MEQKTEKYTLILAALMHDIGKFAHAGKALSDNDSALLESFLNKYKENFPFSNENDFDLFKDIACNCNTGESIQHRIVNLSDILASGNLQDNICLKQAKVEPIFELLFTDNDNKQKMAYPLKPLDIYKQIENNEIIDSFPFAEKYQSADFTEEYAALWNKFEKEFSSVKGLNPKDYINTILNIFQKYLWCVPSSTVDRLDIPLYDHLRMTAAITSCLQNQYLDNYETIFNDIELIKSNSEKSFLLLLGDLNGIQDFIFKITSKMAGKSLKGRSFYLQLLCDAAAKYIIDQFDLLDCNIIFSSGGSFYLLLPANIESKIPEIEKTLNEFILAQFNNEIYLTLGFVPLSIKDFAENKIAVQWENVNIEVGKKKKQKYSLNINEEFFKPYAESYQTLNDLGDDLLDYEKAALKNSLDISSNDDPVIPKNYITFIRLGKELLRSNYIIQVNEILKSNIFAGYNIFKFDFGYSYLFLEDIEDVKKFLIKYSNCRVVVKKLNDTNFSELFSLQSRNLSFGFKFYGGNKAPISSDSKTNKTFDELSGITANSENKKSFNKLAILRMDVDNLGETFISGLSKEKYTISRLANLSNMLDLYFTGYLNSIIADPKFYDNAYIVYAGGDDLFIIGKWNVIPSIAEKIYVQFRKYVNYNKKLTISGAIEVIDPKFPIYRGAILAGNHESEAKNYGTRVDEKNEEKLKDNLFFLTKSLRLRDFEGQSDYNFVKNVKNLIIIANSRSKNKSVLSRFRNIYLEYQRNYSQLIENQDYKNLRIDDIQEHLRYNKWRYRTAYNIKRFKDTIDKNDIDIVKTVDNIASSLYTNNFNNIGFDRHLIAILDVAVRWAEFELRNN